MQDCKCDCVGKPPTYPVYRDTEHLPSCPWYQVEIQERVIARLLKAVARLATAIDMGDDDPLSMEHEVEAILYLGKPTPALESPETSQSSSVTVEKLAQFMRPLRGISPSWARENAEAILKAFPTLGQGRLTREQIEAAVGKFQAKLPTTLAQALKIVGFCQELIDDLMALQPQAQVTREQWEKLWPKGYLTSHRPTENDIRAWLKSELGMEVADHE